MQLETIFAVTGVLARKCYFGANYSEYKLTKIIQSAVSPLTDSILFVSEVRSLYWFFAQLPGNNTDNV
jgi:hypothetical protein